jgi:hypothetical protein
VALVGLTDERLTVDGAATCGIHGYPTGRFSPGQPPVRGRGFLAAFALGAIEPRAAAAASATVATAH